MQVTKLFTVYDSAAEFYLPPFFVPTTGIAIRAFEDCINSDDHQFGKHPDHYTLFYLGEFSDQDATFDLHSPRSCGNGVEFVKPNEPGEPDVAPPNPPIQPDENSRDPSE